MRVRPRTPPSDEIVEASAIEVDLVLVEDVGGEADEQAMLASGTRPVVRPPRATSSDRRDDMLDPPTEDLDALVEEEPPAPRKRLKLRRSWMMMTDEDSSISRSTTFVSKRAPNQDAPHPVPFVREPLRPPPTLPRFPLLPPDPNAKQPSVPGSCSLPHFPLLPPDPSGAKRGGGSR